MGQLYFTVKGFVGFLFFPHCSGKGFVWVLHLLQ